jgi:hypothetical protein
MAANTSNACRSASQDTDFIDILLGGELDEIEDPAPKLRCSSLRFDPSVPSCSGTSRCGLARGKADQSQHLYSDGGTARMTAAVRGTLKTIHAGPTAARACKWKKRSRCSITACRLPGHGPQPDPERARLRSCERLTASACQCRVGSHKRPSIAGESTRKREVCGKANPSTNPATIGLDGLSDGRRLRIKKTD